MIRLLAKLTKLEIAGFQSAFLGSRDMKSSDFKKTFRPVWVQRARKIEIFSRNCGYPIRLLDSRRVTFTLRPEVTLGFSLETKRFLINLLHFFFCDDEESVFFKPPIYLTGEFAHWDNYAKICEELDILGRGKKAAPEFIEKHRLELSREAYLAEIEFLKRAISLANDGMSVRSFRVTSWSTDGFPTCEIKKGMIQPKEMFEYSLHELKSFPKTETSLLQDDSERQMKENRKAHVKIARALNLDKYSPVNLDIDI